MFVCVVHDVAFAQTVQMCITRHVMHGHDGVKVNALAGTFTRTCADVHLLGDALVPTPGAVHDNQDMYGWADLMHGMPCSWCSWAAHPNQ